MAFLFLVEGSNFLLNVGTKAALKAPSANILRKKFGRRKAAKKISDKVLTPRKLAMRMSLIKPRTLEMAMKNEMVEIALISFISDSLSGY